MHSCMLILALIFYGLKYDWAVFGHNLGNPQTVHRETIREGHPTPVGDQCGQYLSKS